MLENFIPKQFHGKFYSLKKKLTGFAVKAYSQEGEDLVLNRFFNNTKNGFYVDVGAHHPQRFSNTYFFYKKGWRGINIDAMPDSMNLFNQTRKRDINLEIAISDKVETLTYYAFEEPAINGFDKELSEERIMSGQKLLFKKEIKTHTLAEVLDKYLPPNTAIDFLSIDVEGIDMQVLKSNNWTKYKPKIVLVEAVGKDIEEVLSEDLHAAMISYGYKLFAKTINTCFYKHIT